jgi:alpha-L-rhamnosidase
MSPFASYFLFKGLYDSDNGNYATSLLCSKNTKEGARTWAYMLDKSKATITTEAWNTTTKPNMTYSHPWSAAPASLIATGLFGIEPTSPAFSTFQLKIQAGNVSSASIQVPTIKGKIKASYQLDRMHTLKSISITIPENTTATIHLPSEASSVIINKERREAFSDGCGNQIVLGSGVYELKIKY